MADTVTITEADMRRAVKDDRYWRRGNPERAGYVGWVTNGFRALAGPEARNGSVQVRAYTRMRDGREETVAAHTRSSVVGSTNTSGDGPAGSPPEADATPVQFAFPVRSSAHHSEAPWRTAYGDASGAGTIRT